MVKIINDCMDVPDKRDYNFEEFAKEFAEGEKINKWPYKEIILFDQGATPACTRFALRHISNGQNINEWNSNGQKFTQVNPMDDWNTSNKIKSLQAALDEAKRKGTIEGYLTIKKDGNLITNINKALSMGCYVYTGSDNGLRGKYKAPYNYMVRTDGKIVGHAYPIVDTSPDGRYPVPNSFGTSRGDKGYFYLLPEQLKYTFTLYAIVDKDDTGKFQTFKMKEKARQLSSLAKELYDNGDSEVKDFFNKIQLSLFLKTKYGI